MQETIKDGFEAASPADDESMQLSTNTEDDELARLEIAHVLFMDIVGYSKLHIEQQTQLRRQLKKIVRNTDEYRRAQMSRAVISRSTGDGMALVYFGDPEAPARCAVEISRALRNLPELQLRMGIHSGPVFRDSDMNDQIDVAGGGINIAQRVMDCGDADHILVSRSVAETLSELRRWENYLHDLGRVEVKHGKLVHVFNLYDGDFGNPEIPEKCRVADTAPSTLVLNAGQIAEALGQKEPQEADVIAYTEPSQSMHRVECVSDDLKGSRVYHLPEADISVFEDTRRERPKYFAWNGLAEDVSRNHHTDIHDTMDEAIAAAIALRYTIDESYAV